MTTERSNATMSVNNGNLIYILVDDRAAFDAITLPVSQGKCLSKTMRQDGVFLIFQHWIKGGVQ